MVFFCKARDWQRSKNIQHFLRPRRGETSISDATVAAMQVELAVDRLIDRKMYVQVFARDPREPPARFHVTSGYLKVGSNAGVTAMKEVFDQLLKFLQQGIAAIFHFVELIWTWSVGQISKLAAVPWQEWPLWKQILLVLILAGVLWALYRAGKQLLEAGAAILAAFAGLLGVLVQTLPHIFLAGVIALGGVWLVNHLDNAPLRMPGWMQATEQNSTPQNQPQNQPQNHPGSTPQNP
jgi:hypothetical protein